MNPASYDSLDAWLVGEPASDYVVDAGAEHRWQVYRMSYGLVLAPPLIARDLVRLGMAPGAAMYYAIDGRGDRGIP